MIRLESFPPEVAFAVTVGAILVLIVFNHISSIIHLRKVEANRRKYNEMISDLLKNHHDNISYMLCDHNEKMADITKKALSDV